MMSGAKVGEYIYIPLHKQHGRIHKIRTDEKGEKVYTVIVNFTESGSISLRECEIARTL